MWASGTLRNLLNGVSQAPPNQRDSSQAEEQVNGLSSLARGLRKRPPTQHVAKLSSDPTGYGSAFDHSYVRDGDEKYRVVVVGGNLKVFNQATGAEQTVLFPHGKTYLNGTDFRAVTVGDTTYIVNRNVVVAKLTRRSDNPVYEAYLTVRDITFETGFAVKLDGVSAYYTAPSSGSLSTDTIAEALRNQLAATFTSGAYVFTRYGSTVHIARADGKDFALVAHDGLSGDALGVVKGYVQTFAELPKFAKPGAILEVTGTPESKADNYFVAYSESETAGEPGVWRETVEPGILVALDPSTMPHQLVRGGNVLDETPSEGTPESPSIAAGAAQRVTGGFTSTDGGAALSESSDAVLTQHSQGVRRAITGADGTQRRVTVIYDLSAAVNYSATTVTARLRTNTGPSTAFTDRATATYSAGSGGYANQSLSYLGSIPAGAEVELQLTYSTGTTPAASSDQARLTAHSKINAGGPGVTIEQDVGTAITFAATRMYPAGCVLTATLDGTAFVHTVGSTDETGAAVATALHTLINAHANFDSSNPSSGVIIAKTAAGAAPGTTTVAITFDIATKFHNPDLAMTPGDHVGRVVKNLTDGSTGTVTANTATTFTVGLLSGGSDNTFAKDDRCVIVGAATEFVFKRAPWRDRAAGDDLTAPFPSFTGRTISDICFYQSRLGVVAGEFIVLSQSGEPMGFFRKSAAQLLADDVIDVKDSLGRVTSFHSAVPWHDGLYLFADQSEWRLSGTPVLTPETVRLDLLGTHPCSSRVRPVVGGDCLFIAAQKNGAVRIAEARVKTTATGEDSLVFVDLTKHVPTYIGGNVVALACDAQAEILAVVTDFEGQDKLYVCVYHDEGDRRVQLSWSHWKFSPGSQLVGLDVLDGVMGLVFKRGDGAHLETITLEPETRAVRLIGDGTALGDGLYTGEGLLL